MGFNLIRKLYLEKENRDIVKEVVKYLGKDIRYRILFPDNYVGVCNICFRKDTFNIIRCIPNNDFDASNVCENCVADHYLEYTTAVSAIKLLSHKMSKRMGLFTLQHHCDFSMFKKKEVIEITKEQHELIEREGVSAIKVSEILDQKSVLRIFHSFK